jgi:hypothetical protein
MAVAATIVAVMGVAAMGARLHMSAKFGCAAVTKGCHHLFLMGIYLTPLNKL